MRVVYICFIIIGILLGCQCLNMASASDLEFEITFDKQKYEEKGPINIEFKLDNKTEKPVYVNKRFFLNSEDSKPDDREVYLLVKSPQGDTLPCKVSNETGLPKTDYFVLLQPGESASPARVRRINHFFDFEEPGTYEITGVYHNVHGKEIGVDAFTKKIKSKLIKIEVVKKDEKKD